MKLIYLFVCSTLVLACSGQSGAEAETEDLAVVDTLTTDTLSLSNLDTVQYSFEDLAEGGALFEFHDFKLLIDTLEVWSDTNIFDCRDTDTTWITLGLGPGIADRKIQISAEGIEDLEVHQSYETSITVMNEGPHCDLSNWKHYNSEWEKLAIDNSVIQTIKYSEEEWEKFIEVDMNELVEEVRKNCGDEWAEHTSDAQSPTDYPCGVGVSVVYLMVQYTREGYSALTTKYLAFEVPMGC